MLLALRQLRAVDLLQCPLIGWPRNFFLGAPSLNAASEEMSVLATNAWRRRAKRVGRRCRARRRLLPTNIINDGKRNPATRSGVAVNQSLPLGFRLVEVWVQLWIVVHLHLAV